MSKSMTTGQKSLALPPDAGETFNPGQKITIKIDETVGYITPDSYLLVNIQNTSSDHSRWTLPNAAGASAIIKTVRIYSTRTGELLETLQNYNQWVSIENQYRHNDITVHQRTQGLGKTTAQYILVANQIEADPHSANPNDVESNQISPVLTDLTPAYEPRQMIIPLKTGILGHWQDQDTAVPVLNMGGLTIELTLAPVSEVCCQMQMFGANADLTNQEVSKIPETKMNDLILLSAEANTNTFLTDTDYRYFKSIYDLGLAKGMKVLLKGEDSSPTPVSFTLTRTVAQVDETALEGGGQLSITFEETTAFTNFPLTNLRVELLDTPSLSYQVSNVRLVCNQLALTPQAIEKLGKPLNYEFMSYDLFFNNILPTEMKHQVPFNSVATKAKALFTHYVNTSTEATPDLKTYYNGLRPSQSLINDVVYYINNTLMPAQSYNPSNYGDKVIQTNELQKALRAANIPVVNLGDNKAGNLNIYTNTFLTARELARGDFIYDLSNAEPELRLEFSGSREFNIRTYSFVFSKKVVTIGPQGVKVVL